MNSTKFKNWSYPKDFFYGDLIPDLEQKVTGRPRDDWSEPSKQEKDYRDLEQKVTGRPRDDWSGPSHVTRNSYPDLEQKVSGRPRDDWSDY